MNFLNDDRDSILSSSDELESVIPSICINCDNVPVIMDTYPLLNEQNDQARISMTADGYLVLQSRNPRQHPDFEKQLKHPKEIDPFKVNVQIIFLSILIISVCILYGISFTLRIFILPKYIELGVCGIECLKFALIILYYSWNMSWCRFLSDSGFYRFPKIVIFRRTLVIFVWSISALILSPILLTIKILCDQDTPEEQFKSCLNGLSNINLMQLYLGLETVLVLILISWHLSSVIKFKMERRWPDIWHERLLEESPLVDWCPLVMLSELRAEDSGVTHDVTQRSKSQQIMQSQGYVIDYLVKRNGRLATKITALTRETQDELITRIESNNLPELRVRRISFSSLSSVNTNVQSSSRQSRITDGPS